MRIGVLHVNTSTPTSTSPTMRIARFVADELGAPLICSQSSAKEHVRPGKKFDVLFVKYGMLKFSQHRDEALEIYRRAGRVINMENDYLFALDKRFRAPDETWSTVENRTRYVNWNMLTRHDLDDWKNPGPMPTPTRDGLVYYGAHRPDRAPSFKRYFHDAPYPVTISTFRGRRAFEAYGERIKVIGAFRDPDAQAAWPATIYVEDEASHRTYCSPATRFYECVMAGVAQFVDEDAAGTLRKAGVVINQEFVVNSQRGLRHAMRHCEETALRQRRLWFRNYADEIRSQFDEACLNSKIWRRA